MKIVLTGVETPFYLYKVRLRGLHRVREEAHFVTVERYFSAASTP